MMENEQEEIIEGNKLIAEFMGMKHMTSKGWEHCYVGAIKSEDLTFHNDWNKLMPVVEKIEMANGCPYRVIIASNLTYITDKSKRGTPEVVRAANNSRLSNTWLAVVKFIKWYNNNK